MSMTATEPQIAVTPAPPAGPRPRMADACAVVLFGASGDLAMRKLLPALYNLKTEGLLNDHFSLVGVGRDPMSREQYREKVQRDIIRFGPSPVDAERVAWLAARATYISGAYDSEVTSGSCATSCSAAAVRPARSSIWPRRPACSSRSSNGSGRPDWPAKRPARGAA